MARPEVRICLRPVPGFKLELSLYHPASGKEAKSGLKLGPRQADIDAEVRKIKAQLERAGNEVQVVKLDRRW